MKTVPAEPVKRHYPFALLSETPVPVWEGATNGSLLENRDELASALALCNGDKRTMRRWLESQE